MSTKPDQSDDTGTCGVCDEQVQIDGEQAIERFGDVLCADCAGKPVAFEAECRNQFCDWEHRVESTEFNRGHLKTRIHQEKNHHVQTKRVFDDDRMHRVEIEEVDDAE